MQKTVINEIPTKECKGIFWKGKTSAFVSSHKSIEIRKSLILLKRKSCPGCEECECIWEHLNEDIWEEYSYLNNIENNKIYTFKVNILSGIENGIHYEEVSHISFIEAE